MACADPENFPEGGTGGGYDRKLWIIFVNLLYKLKKFELFMGDWRGGGSGPRLSRSA